MDDNLQTYKDEIAKSKDEIKKLKATIEKQAIKLLCSLLEDKYPQLVKEFKSLNKWYA